MNKMPGRKFCFFGMSRAELKTFSIPAGLMTSIVLAAVVWICSGFQGITPTQWVFVGMAAGFLLAAGYRGKRDRDREMMTRKLLCGPDTTVLDATKYNRWHSITAGIRKRKQSQS